jgi:hypothetical protein
MDVSPTPLSFLPPAVGLRGSLGVVHGVLVLGKEVVVTLSVKSASELESETRSMLPDVASAGNLCGGLRVCVKKATALPDCV